MKNLFLYLFLFFTIISHSQSDYEYKNLDKNLIEKYSKFDYIIRPECEKLMTLAKKNVLNDSIYIPQHNFDKITLTMREILKREYGFYDNDIVQGNLIIPEVLCFENYMIEASKIKYGSNFIDSISQISDSLDKINMGYEKSFFQMDSLDLNSYLKTKIKDIENYIQGHYFRIITFNVEKDGTLSNIEYKQGLFNVVIEVEDIKDEKILFELSKLMQDMPKWIPAKFKGTPIKERNSIILNTINIK